VYALYILTRKRLFATSLSTELPKESFQDRHFWNAYGWEFTAISFIFINLFLKNFLTRKRTIKINNANSTGSHWNYMKYVRLVWPPAVTEQTLYSSGLYWLYKITILPRIQLCLSDPIVPFILCRRLVSIKIAFAMTIKKAQGQTLKRVGIYPPSPVFPHGQLFVAFSPNPFI
jgi:hypothetical protein